MVGPIRGCEGLADLSGTGSKSKSAETTRAMGRHDWWGNIQGAARWRLGGNGESQRFYISLDIYILHPLSI